MPTNTQAEARPRRALGKRPAFYGDERLDMLFAMLTTLLGEVSVIRERIDTHERLLEKAGLFGKDTVDAWLPDAEAEAERAPIRQQHDGPRAPLPRRRHGTRSGRRRTRPHLKGGSTW